MAAIVAQLLPCGCTFWVDRHVHKSGGTTVRNLMHELEIHGRSLHISGWSFGVDVWKRLMHAIGSLKAPCALPSDLLVTLELHENMGRNFEREWLEPLRRLRRQDTCCRVLLTTRLRQPLEHYISVFRWGVVPRHPEASFEQWAPPSLQSVLLMWGPYRQWAMGNTHEGAARWYASFGATEMARAAAALDIAQHTAEHPLRTTALHVLFAYACARCSTRSAATSTWCGRWSASARAWRGWRGCWRCRRRWSTRRPRRCRATTT
jgi:hypothetical protein